MFGRARAISNVGRRYQLTDSLAAADVVLSEDVRKACHEVGREILYPMG